MKNCWKSDWLCFRENMFGRYSQTSEYWMMFLYLLISNGYDFVGLNYRVLVPQKWSKTSLVGEVFSWNPICPNVSPRIIKCLVVFGSVSIPGWLCKSIWAVKKDKFVVFKWCSSPTVSTGLWFHPLRVNLSYCQPGCLYGLGLNRLFLFAQVDHHLNCSRTYVYVFWRQTKRYPISNDFLNTCYILIRCTYIYQYYLFMLFIIHIYIYIVICNSSSIFFVVASPVRRDIHIACVALPLWIPMRS